MVEGFARGHRIARGRVDEIPKRFLDEIRNVVDDNADVGGQVALHDGPVKGAIHQLGERARTVAEIGHDGVEHIHIGCTCC